MRRDELDELHYVTPISNVPSICRMGILSNRRARGVSHESVASQLIQNRRAQVEVPGGRPLHEYANLYICARNPMRYLRRSRHAELCILRAEPNVLDLPDVVVTDGNASSRYVRFTAAPQGLKIVNKALTFAEDWTDTNYIEYLQKKSAKCAEVLVPDVVESNFIVGAYVSCEESIARLNALGVSLEVAVNRHLFFL